MINGTIQAEAYQALQLFEMFNRWNNKELVYVYILARLVSFPPPTSDCWKYHADEQ